HSTRTRTLSPRDLRIAPSAPTGHTTIGRWASSSCRTTSCAAPPPRTRLSWRSCNRRTSPRPTSGAGTARRSNDPPRTMLTPPVGPRDHAAGPANAHVTLVEFGDFECPFCGRAYPELKRVLKPLGPKVQFVFRHFPLILEHPHAQHAAEVAEAAAAQGKFWEMHDLLYQHQDALEDDDLLGYARQLGLDVPRVQREL